MKIMIDKNVEVGISFTTLGGGKIVLDIPNSEVSTIVEAILEEKGAQPIAGCLTKEDMEDILEAFKFDDVMQYYGVKKVLKWVEENR